MTPPLCPCPSCTAERITRRIEADRAWDASPTMMLTRRLYNLPPLPTDRERDYEAAPF